MPRPKANKDKVAMAPQPVAPAIAAPHLIKPEHFVQVRDAFLTRLHGTQTLLGGIINDFTRQSNLLLGVAEDTSFGGPSGQALMAFENTLDQLTSFNPAFPATLPATMTAPVAAPPAEEQKKERKKRTHDPNAPKRPLTPYFLYMQTARPIIANDLGAAAPKGAVQEEGQRRWATMSAHEKAGWNNAYQYNLRLYNARVHSYKAGNVDAKNMDDGAAAAYADANGIPLPTPDDHGVNDQAAIAEQLGGADAHGEVDDAPAPKAKKGGAGRKRKTAGEDEIVPPATPASPQKRRRSTKAAETEEPKKSGRKKATKA